MRTSINEIFRAELTEEGRHVYSVMAESLTLPKLDGNIVELPLWKIMQIFGSSMSGVSQSLFKRDCIKNLQPGRNHVRLASTVKEIHNICNKAGVTKGHIVDRVERLANCEGCGCSGCGA